MKQKWLNFTGSANERTMYKLDRANDYVDVG